MDPGRNEPFVPPTATVAIASTSENAGYWLVNRSGAVHAVGDAPFLGS